jgi:hypothetical protein
LAIALGVPCHAVRGQESVHHGRGSDAALGKYPTSRPLQGNDETKCAGAQAVGHRWDWLLALSDTQTNLFFQVIAKRYETSAAQG